MNYPYAFDQEQKADVDFQEQLYRAQNAESRQIVVQERQDALFPRGDLIEEFAGSRDFAQALCDMCAIEGQLE